MSTAGRGIVYSDKNSNTGFFSPQQERVTKFYPNPTGNMLYSSDPAKRIEIFGLSGVKLNETNQSEIQVGQLMNGCYIARLTTEEGIYNQLFVKK